MQALKTAFLSILAALGMTGGLYAADGLSQVDENGIVPHVWWKFDGDTADCGSVSPTVSGNFGNTYVLSQDGWAITSQGCYGGSINSDTSWQWTLTVVAKAVTTTENGVLFSLGNRNGSDGTKTRGIALASGGPGKITVSPFAGSTAHSDVITAEVSTSDSAYHFYAVTMDTDKKVTLYVDGTKIDSAVLAATNDPAEGHWQFCSINGNVNNTGFVAGNDAIKKACFDDVRFYRQTLSETEIAKIAESFPAWTGEITLAEGETLTLQKDTRYLNVNVNANTKIDLNGHDLTIRSMTRIPSSGDNIVTITNSVDGTQSTMTAGVNGGEAQCNYLGRFGGNLKYVTTGTDDVRFWGGDNYHTGGTVFSNVSLRVRSPKQFGTGAVTLTAGAEIQFATTNPVSYDYGSFTNDVYVYGSGNKLNFDPSANDNTTVTMTGKILGDGALCIGNGHSPSIYLNGDTSQFTGTLLVHYLQANTKDWKGVYIERANNYADGTASLESASVMITNKVAEAKNYFYIAGKQGSLDTVYKIGNLTTGSDDPEMYTNAYLRTYKDGLTLEVGALGKSGTFAANIHQYETKTSGSKTSLVKVGTGTWTLTGTNHYYLGTTTVKGGRLNIDSAEFTAGTEIIVTNAVLGGTGTIKVPITVKKDGTLAGSFAATAGVTFEAGSIVEVAAGAASTPTISGTIDASALTVKLTGELNTANEYTILTAGSGSSGRATVEVDDDPPANGSWRTKWVTSGDTKILKGYYVKSGLVIIFK